VKSKFHFGEENEIENVGAGQNRPNESTSVLANTCFGPRVRCIRLSYYTNNSMCYCENIDYIYRLRFTALELDNY